MPVPASRAVPLPLRGQPPGRWGYRTSVWRRGSGGEAARGLLGAAFFPKKKETSLFFGQALPCALLGTEVNTQELQESKRKTGRCLEDLKGKPAPETVMAAEPALEPLVPRCLFTPMNGHPHPQTRLQLVPLLKVILTDTPPNHSPS